MNDLDWMRWQVEALFIHNAEGFITSIDDTDPPWSAPRLAPLFFLGRTKDGPLWRFREDVPTSLREDLTRLAESEPLPEDLSTPPVHFDRYRSLLEEFRPVTRVYRGPAYRFPDVFPSAEDVISIHPGNFALLNRVAPWMADFDFEKESFPDPYCAVVRDGIAVSICRSVRLSDRVGEAGVDTLEEYRGKGYAGQVTAAWASRLREMGREPLYSTSWDNFASQSVARKLGMILYGEDVSFNGD
jgi:RimJ/RimL family protein N-acetyltransferase